MSTLTEQRVCIKFCFKNNFSPAETFRMLQKCYGDECLSRARAFSWYKMFKNGRVVVDNLLDNAGRPATSINKAKIQEVNDLVLQNGRITIKEIAKLIPISFGSIQTILTKYLNLKRISSCLVPKLLRDFEKEKRIQFAKEMLSLEEPETLQNIISGDLIWFYAYDGETSEKNPKRVVKKMRKTKILLTVFFDCNGLVYHEIISSDQPVKADYYLSVMQKLQEAVHEKRFELWLNNSWFLHHTNILSQSSCIREFLNNHYINVLPQAAHSPDMTPVDFFLFPKLKLPAYRVHTHSLEDIKQDLLRVLTAIPKIEYEKCFDEWQRRWHKCVYVKGEYLVGDEINVG